LFAEFALAFGAFTLKQVAPTGLRPNDLTRGCKLETLGYGLLGFATGYGFWHGGWKISESRAYGNRKVCKNYKEVSSGQAVTQQRWWFFILILQRTVKKAELMNGSPSLSSTPLLAG
jgi:hypothetical protein